MLIIISTIYYVGKYLEDKSNLVVVMLWNRIKLLEKFKAFL